MPNDAMIFYIDDDQDDLMLFEIAASATGVDARIFDNAGELLDALRTTSKPAILFLDLNMSVKSGYEILQEMKADDGLDNIPVVVLSTAGDPYTTEKSRKAGAAYFIEKPTSQQKLRAAIAHTLGIDWRTFKPDAKDFIHKH